MSDTIKVTDYQLLDHGIDGAQYFPGCGTAFTDYDHCTTGNGDTFAEALDDCLESIAQDGIDTEDLSARLTADGYGADYDTRSAIAECRQANGQMSDEEWEDCAEEMDVYYYVSIRYCLPAGELTESERWAKGRVKA